MPATTAPAGWKVAGMARSYIVVFEALGGNDMDRARDRASIKPTPLPKTDNHPHVQQSVRAVGW